jgi:hypothetical protein
VSYSWEKIRKTSRRHSSGRVLWVIVELGRSLGGIVVGAKEKGKLREKWREEKK